MAKETIKSIFPNLEELIEIHGIISTDFHSYTPCVY